MTSEDLGTVLRKVEEVKALMVFAQRSMPFLEDLFVFVRDIVPVMEEMHRSVQVSSEKLPKASKQLDNVTSATEMASTEILNLIEGIFGKLDGVEKTLGEGTPAAVRPALGSIREDCTNIMIALQVQDITAQQIAAVNRLMQSVDDGMARLMRSFTRVQTENDPGRFRHRQLDIAFDTAAEYAGGEERQKMVDAVVEQITGQKPRRERTPPGAGGAASDDGAR